MKKIRFERAGLEVSNLCLGTMLYGTTTDEKEAFRQLDMFLDMGGNFIDTSNNYAHWIPGAVGDESEKLIGRWLADRKCRDRLVIATKVGFDRHGSGQGLKASQIEYWIDESLKNMGTDYVDLYYSHIDDMDTPLAETLGAFDDLVKKGKVRAIGASNHYTWRLTEAKYVAKENGFTPYTVNQQCYTYLYTRNDCKVDYIYKVNADDAHIRYLADNNIPLVTFSCLMGGGYDNNDRIPANYLKGKRLEVITETAKELGMPVSMLVLAWLIGSDRLPDRPTVVPLFSSSRSDHLMQSLAMSDYDLDEEILKKLTYAKI